MDPLTDFISTTIESSQRATDQERLLDAYDIQDDIHDQEDISSGKAPDDPHIEGLFKNIHEAAEGALAASTRKGYQG